VSNGAECEIQSLLEYLGTHPDRGLSEVEAYNRLRRFGTNELERPYLRFRQVRVAALLCLAMAVVLTAKGTILPALGAAAVGAGLVGLASALMCRYKQSVLASDRPVQGVCTGIRGGRLLHLPVCRLVPGDIVRIETGDIVPADGRLTEALNLAIQEKELSGSLEPVKKDALKLNDASAQSEGAESNVFMNTMVVRGRGTFVVTKTGKNTRIGRLRDLARGKRVREN
jgi:P-type Ca2+ transporter type 2C